MTKKLPGAPPKKCDICGSVISKEFIDGKTSMGPWAFMCLDCHDDNGCGLGLGFGQHFVKDPDSSDFVLQKYKKR